MRAISFTVVLAATLVVAIAARAAAGDLLWVDRVDRSGGVALDAGHAAVAGGGRFFASGNSAGEDGDQDLIVRAYDREGGLLWQDVYDPADGPDTALDLAVDGGRLYAGGRSVTAAGSNLLVRAYDARTGAVLWQNEAPSAGGFGVVRSIVAKGARVFAAGDIFRAAGDTDYHVRAYDARTGTVLWQDRIDEGPGDRARHVAVHDGRAYVVGAVGGCSEFFETGGDCDFLLRAYDARTGAVLWQDRLDLGTTDLGRAVAVAGGRVFAVGFGGDFVDRDFLVRAYDATNGVLAWHDRLDTAGAFDAAYSVAVQGRRVFAAGRGGACAFLTDPASDCDGLVRAYDTKTGALIWSDQVDLGRDDFLGANATTGAIEVQRGRLHLIGTGGDCRPAEPSDCNWLVRVYQVRDGALAWEAQFDNAGGDDDAHDLAFHGGRLFVVGLGERAAGPPFPLDDWDIVALAYDASGGENDDDD
jgi:outer membrane protein assembly factor BamB